MKPLVNNTGITRATIQFKQPITPPKPAQKVTAKKPEPKKVVTTTKGKFRFSSKVSVLGYNRIAMTRLLLNHERILNKAKSVIEGKRNMTDAELRSQIQEFIEETGMTPVIYTSVDLDIVNMLRQMRTIGSIKPRKRMFLSFKESSMSNLRFTISPKRDRIFIEGLDLIINVDKKIPAVLEFEDYFYLNISCINPTQLNDLKLGIFSA